MNALGDTGSGKIHRLPKPSNTEHPTSNVKVFILLQLSVRCFLHLFELQRVSVKRWQSS
jgi:hypothetical protein